MDLLDLFVRIGVKDEATKAIGGIARSVGGGLKGAAKVGAGAMAGMTAAAAKGTVAIGKAALQGYADYEQLLGGVQKLYGDASDEMLAYAEQAYMTSGMSANEYMETATQFSAALINSMGGDVEAAAEKTDVAMRLISDNVNTFGSDAEAVKNAVVGLSRQNYTLIDNLKLGYAGTSQGMLELINDSGVLGYTLTDTAQLADIGFGTMIDAIQAVQEQQGIAGTTAKEAASTISGSIDMASSAWDNLLAAVANPDADLDEMVTAFTDSVQHVIDNILPRIETIGQGIAQALPAIAEALLPAVASLLEQLIPVVIEIIPSLIDAASQVITVLCNYLPQLIPLLISGAFQLFGALVTGVTDNGPAILAAVKQALLDICSEVLGGEGYFTSFKNVGLYLLNALKVGAMEQLGVLENKIKAIPGEVASWVEGNKQEIYDKGVAMLGNFVEGILFKRAELAGWAVNLVADVLGWIGDNWTEIEAKGSDLLNGLITGVNAVMENLSTIFQNIVTSVAGWVAEGNLQEIVDKGAELIGSITSGVSDGAGSLVDIFTGLVANVVTWIGDHWDGITEKGGEIIGAILTGVSQAAGGLVDMFTGLLGDVVTWIGDSWDGITAKGGEIIGAVLSGVVQGAGDLVSMFTGLVGDVVGWIGDNYDQIGVKGGEIIGAVLSGVSQGAVDLVTMFTGLLANVVDWIGQGNAQELIDKGFEIIGGFFSGIIKGITGEGMEGGGGLQSTFEGLPDEIVGWLGDTLFTLGSQGHDLLTGFYVGFSELLNGTFKDDMVNFLGTVAGFIGSAVGTLLELGGDFLAGFISGAEDKENTDGATFFGGLLDLVKRIITTGIDVATFLGEIGTSIISGFLDGVTGGKWTEIKEWFADLPEKVKTEIGNLGDTLAGKGKDLINGFLGGVKEIFGIDLTQPGEVLKFVQGIPDKVVQFAGNMKDTLSEKGKDLLTGFFNGIMEIFGIDVTTEGSVLAMINGIPQKIIDALGNLGDTLWQAGVDLVNGFTGGIEAFVNDPIGTVAGLGQSLIDAATGALDENSPSKEFEDIGENVVLGLDNGLQSEQDTPDGTLTGIAGGLSSNFVDAYWQMHDQGVALMTSFGTGLSNAFYGGYGVGSVAETIGSIGGSIESYFTAGFYTLYGAGQQIMLGLNEGIVSTWNNTVIPNLQTITNNIPNWKGPLDKDRRLLTDNGEAIMDGLMAGIETGAGRLYGMLGDVTSAIPSAATATGQLAPAAAGGTTINMADAFRGANISFRSREDMREFSEMLADTIARETTGRYLVA